MGCEDVNCPILMQELEFEMKTKIIELMPDMDTWPEWAITARDDGSLFGECMERIRTLSDEYDRLWEEKDLEANKAHKRVAALQSQLEQAEKDLNWKRAELKQSQTAAISEREQFQSEIATQTLRITELEAKIAEFIYDENHGESWPPGPGR